jgi:hypothetical protein
MQASPYDLTDLGVEPICIETSDGRVEYVERQRDFTRRAEPLRTRLAVLADRLAARSPVPGADVAPDWRLERENSVQDPPQVSRQPDRRSR